MLKRSATNVDLVVELMNYCPYGALGQAFIIEAITHYCKQVKTANPIGPGHLINSEAWHGMAQDYLQRIEEFYAR
jgi:hypothetical protein